MINAVDFDFVNPATGDSTVRINRGETVTFSYPEGSSFHNVDFQVRSQPSSCTLTGNPTADVPPLHRRPLVTGGLCVCTFNTDGIYLFVCQAYPA